MTDETKQLFDAPWKASNGCVTDAHGRCVSTSFNHKDAAILQYLPDLYDIVKETIVEQCADCYKHGCLTCRVNEWKEILKRIREPHYD